MRHPSDRFEGLLLNTNLIQISVFAGLTALVAVLTWWKCRHSLHSSDESKDYFLAGGGLSWPFVAGSLLLALTALRMSSGRANRPLPSATQIPLPEKMMPSDTPSRLAPNAGRT